MLDQIKGLHHVTSMASSAPENNRFFTQVLGLRRVKTTVNFDEPSVYHLYYGDEVGTPGSVMTYFPFPNIAPGKRGTGEVGTTVFSVPEGSIDYWEQRLGEADGASHLQREGNFGETGLGFSGPDGERFSLVEVADDSREPWAGSDVPTDAAIRGFHSVSLRLDDAGGTDDLLKLMGYQPTESWENIQRYAIPDGNGANFVDVEVHTGANPSQLGAGSVHHVAFAVENQAREMEVRKVLAEAGHAATPVIDRDYFRSVYFRTPGGVLFEIATNDPGFTRDEDAGHLGEALKLPSQHEHLREKLETTLEPLDG